MYRNAIITLSASVFLASCSSRTTAPDALAHQSSVKSTGTEVPATATQSPQTSPKVILLSHQPYSFNCDAPPLGYLVGAVKLPRPPFRVAGYFQFREAREDNKYTPAFGIELVPTPDQLLAHKAVELVAVDIQKASKANVAFTPADQPFGSVLGLVPFFATFTVAPKWVHWSITVNARGVATATMGRLTAPSALQVESPSWLALNCNNAHVWFGGVTVQQK